MAEGRPGAAAGRSSLPQVPTDGEITTARGRVYRPFGSRNDAMRQFGIRLTTPWR